MCICTGAKMARVITTSHSLKKYIIYQHECYFHENNTNIKNILLLVLIYIRFDSLKLPYQFYNPSCITHCALQTVLTYGIQYSSYPYIPVYNYRINCCNHGHSFSPLKIQNKLYLHLSQFLFVYPSIQLKLISTHTSANTYSIYFHYMAIFAPL